MELSEDERRTLREMGVFHPHARTWMREHGVFRLSQGLTLQKTADEFGTLEQRRTVEATLGKAWPGWVVQGHHTGRPRKWTVQQQQVLGALARSEGGSVNALLRDIAQCRDHAPISESTAKRYLKEMNLKYKRYRYGLKKSEIRWRSSAPEK